MADVGNGARDLDAWLAPFLDVLGRKTRRTWAPLCLRGLLGPGERKSLRPMAACLGLSGHDQLQHFIAGPAWDDGPLWRVLAGEADRLVGGPGAALVVDDTALPKKGALSVGVARQYCGQLGKKASCQALVSLTLARGEVPIPVGLRLFPADEWTGKAGRCARAGVPGAAMAPTSKGEIALAEVDRLRAAGARFGTVLADAGCGASAEFRSGLDERGLLWAAGIPRNQRVYGTGVRLVPPAASWRTRSRVLPRRCSRACPGGAWPGGAARRGRSPPGSRRSGSASATAPPGATTATCRAGRSGWWANTARRASGNTTSPTCRPGRRCAPSPPPSRRAGCASRRTSSSSRNWAWATSRGAPGPGCIATR
ncbi:hypothetical protein GCM10009416_45450 [Craurococcus roseus]|uniref:Transposase IS701-like DDE domain-containing protein n=1 Tax=Craurococcus roseus TaxID=77585 RepID=A0ABN1G200_9PROT